MDDQSPQLTASEAAVQAVTENADRLGLKWDLKPASVDQVSASTGITVAIDGDTTPVTATTMIGRVYQRQRVYVLLVPPGGVFIVGQGTPTRIGALIRRVNNLTVNSGVATTVTWDTVAQVSGGQFITVPSTTITVPVDGVYGITYGAFMSAGGGARNFCSINFLGGAMFGADFRSFYGATEGFASANATVPLTAGQQFNCDIFQNSGGAQNMIGILAVTRLTA